MGPVGASSPARRSRRAMWRARATMRSWASWAGSSGRSSPDSSAAPEGATRNATRRRAMAAARRAAAQSGSTAWAAFSIRSRSVWNASVARGGQDAVDHGAGLGGVEVGQGAGEDPGFVFLEDPGGHRRGEGGEAFEDVVGELEAAGGVALRPAQGGGDDLPGAAAVGDAVAGVGLGAAGLEDPAGLGEGGLVGVGEPGTQAGVDLLAGQLAGVGGEQQYGGQRVGGVEQVLGVGAGQVGGEEVLVVAVGRPAHHHCHDPNTRSKVRHPRPHPPCSAPK